MGAATPAELELEAGRVSGFAYPPGSPERRAADRGWIASHGRASVKNPARYNRANARAFGVATRSDDDGWLVKWRGAIGTERFESLEELLDAGWTVD
jgi:hypothetical protein